MTSVSARLLFDWIDDALALQAENERWRDVCTALLFAFAQHAELCELACGELEGCREEKTV